MTATLERLNAEWLTSLAIVALLGLIAVPMVIPEAGRWAGLDGMATGAVTGSNPSYQPWFQPVWTPPSGEVKSALFALQAALGGGIVGYYLGTTAGD